tara:strand:- start:3 stop:488 length:486 start_codon:yes stop_codon:yes gene_type:complete
MVKQAKETGLEILTNLRKIIRAVDLNSKKLSSESNLTSPQILSLAAVAAEGPMTLASIAEAVHLSSSTMVGIIDRLEAKGFLKRERSTKDRRQVFIDITSEGKKIIKKAPRPLQDKLVNSLKKLSKKQQNEIIKSLELLVEMLDAEKVKVAPILTTSSKPL